MLSRPLPSFPHLLRLPLLASALLGAMAIGLFASSAAAQIVDLRDDSRDEAQLKLEVRAAVERDTDVANTALVFNNATNEATAVFCTAYSADGRVLGRKTARIPARGLRYLRASDLSGGADFIGSAVCSTRARIAASAVFLAPGAVTSLDVIQMGPWDDTKMRFPLVATY